jgi:hypothetical protein
MIGTENFYPQLIAERRRAMSYTISTLLSRNLQDVFGENDPARRRAAKAARRRNLSANSLAAYERTWTLKSSWAALVCSASWMRRSASTF